MQFYFELKKPGDLRINLMSAAKNCIILTNTFQELEDVRTQKIDVLKKIKEDIKNLDELNSNLHKLLEDKELRKELQQTSTNYATNIKKEFAQRKEEHLTKTHPSQKTNNEELPQKIIETKNKTTKKEIDDIDRFEYTLEKIEKKLAELKK